MQVTWLRSLGQEDPLEKERATHSSIHAWKIPWTEEPGGISQMETSTLSVYNIQPRVKNIQYRLLCSHHTFYRYFHFSTYKLWLNICVYLCSTHLIFCKLGWNIWKCLCLTIWPTYALACYLSVSFFIDILLRNKENSLKTDVLLL